MDFLRTLKEDGARIDRILEKICAGLPESEVKRAALYSLFPGGKRIRPALVFETARMLGAPENDGNIERIAAAVEMIHTYSLIHDDLPCMDNDDFRRGKPSCHKAFGDGMAVLAGDALLNLAFETLFGGEYSENYFSAAGLVAGCAGAKGMVLGQSDDISGVPAAGKAVFRLAENKTAKLIVASTAPVGIYLNCSKAELEHLNDFALNFGVAFQLADDLLDDAGALGNEMCREALKEYSGRADEAADFFGARAAFLKELVKLNTARKS